MTAAVRQSIPILFLNSTGVINPEKDRGRRYSTISQALLLNAKIQQCKVMANIVLTD